MASESGPTIKLAPPGAGLPFLERWLSRGLFFLARQVMSRTGALDRFQTEAFWMLEIVEQMVPDSANERVLIPRLWGLEDSSRHWSAWMTLDHLVIVDTGIVTIIETLVKEKPIHRKVSTAAVKPASMQSRETVQRFQDAIRQYTERIGRLPGLCSKSRHKHPWFGPLNAHG